MSSDEPLSPTTGGATPDTGQETRHTARLLPVCCVCGLIRDELGRPPEHVRWMTTRTYRNTYHVNPTDRPLTHTYCPECLTKVQDRAKRYFTAMRA